VSLVRFLEAPLLNPAKRCIAGFFGFMGTTLGTTTMCFSYFKLTFKKVLLNSTSVLVLENSLKKMTED
jgi:hypothetical protein